MIEELEKRRIWIFILFAFGISWIIGLIIYITGGIATSPILIKGTNFTLALVLLAAGYMMAPALANILSRWITHEGKESLYLRPRIRIGWPYWIAAWIMPAIMTILGAAVFFAIFPQYFESSLKLLSNLTSPASQTCWIEAFNLSMLILAGTLAAIAISPIINGLFTFGEEFGWRGYLLPKLLPLGGRKAILITGIIWGVWHWPVIAMGHNYGFNYPGSPWTGMMAMVWFTVIVGTFLGWVTLRSGSVWPAVIGHAAINGISGLPLLFVQAEPNLLLGPAPTGFIASLVWTLLAIGLFWSPKALAAPNENTNAIDI